MMIAEKILACCAGAVDPKNTVFLAFKGPPGGAPDAIIGQLHSSTRVSSDGLGGAVLQSDGVAKYLPIAAPALGAGDFLLDVVFDGTTLLTIETGSSHSVAVFGGYAYLSTSGTQWDYVIPISPPPGRNHLALGRQSGVVQVWLNGARLFRAVDAAAGADPRSQIIVKQYPQTGADMTVHSVRICYGVDLYGDNANITVPTLPLGIV